VTTPQMQIEQMDLGALVPDPANPRTHDERNLNAIMASLGEHGQVEPLLVQAATGMVIAGNGRREAMLRLGWTEATVALLDVDDTQARRLSIALNRSGELAGWDEHTLAGHLQALAKVGEEGWLAGLGFDGTELDELVAAYGGAVDELAMVPPPPPEPPAEPPTAPPLPDGTAPAPMPTSGVRMVQLFLDDGTIEPFQLAVRRLAKKFGTDNVTDTVRRAVLEQDGTWVDDEPEAG